MSDRNKPWFRQPKLHAYAVNSRAKNRTFLIVCEGQTEEQYFRSFPVLTATVKPIHHGNSKTNLVEAVKRYAREGYYDEIWCVFDFDVNPLVVGQSEDFNRAIDMAFKRDYRCAYSNDAFELWFVLHYQYLDQKQPRTFFYELLSNRWSIDYVNEGKSLRFARGIYSRLADDTNANQQRAIEHARHLYAIHKDSPFHLQNPVTTVFKLVEELNKHSRK